MRSLDGATWAFVGALACFAGWYITSRLEFWGLM
jgi:hypothetical protein